MTSTGLVQEHQGAERIRDPGFGAALAQEWVAQRRPGLSPRGTRTHSVLYRGPGDVSARVAIELAAGDPDVTAESLTLLIRARDGATSVAEFPDDPALPSLATMLDPRTALEVLMRAAPELSNGLSRRVDLRCDADLVHHPRTGAGVVRYDLSDCEGAVRRVYAKVYPSAAEARRSAVAHGALGGRLLRGDAVVRLPRLLGLDIDTRTVLIESLGPADPRSAEVLPREAVQVLRTLHTTTAPSELPQVTAEDELARLRDELALVRTRWPDLASAVAVHVDTAAEHLGRSREGSSVLSHGDFTPSQLLRVSPGVIGLIDLDTLRQEEPAVDLGRFLAYSSLRQARRRTPSQPASGPEPSAVEELRATVLNGYGNGAAGAPLDRVQAHERLQLALVALRAARRFKEERVSLALALLDHASSRRPS